MTLPPYKSPITPERRAERRELTALCEGVYDDCAKLPQFISCTRDGRAGLFNLLNGCIVHLARTNPARLVVRWTTSTSTTSDVVLETKEQLQRFLAVMNAQAALVNYRFGGSDAGPSEPPQEQP